MEKSLLDCNKSFNSSKKVYWKAINNLFIAIKFTGKGKKFYFKQNRLPESDKSFNSSNKVYRKARNNLFIAIKFTGKGEKFYFKRKSKLESQ